MSINHESIQSLVEGALRARQAAYAPYSSFQVGAAILGGDGCLYTGCNVENASYGLTICAERNATFAMVAAGCRSISALAIALPGAGSPCGACRQVLVEFGRDFPVFLVDSSTGAVADQWSIEELLPAAFRPSSLQ